MTETLRRDWLWVPALVLDGVALLGLFLLGLGSYLGFGVGLFVFVLGALVGASILPALVFSCFAMGRLLRRRGAPRPVIAAVLTASVLVAGAAAPVVVTVFSGLTPNPAADRLRPVVDEIQAAGGKRLCDNGDPGLGPDNIQPWKTVYYRVPARPGLEQHLRQVAASNGLTAGKNSGETYFDLVVTQQAIRLTCSTGTYGRLYTATPGDATVVAHLQLPSRSR